MLRLSNFYRWDYGDRIAIRWIVHSTVMVLSCSLACPAFSEQPSDVVACIKRGAVKGGGEVPSDRIEECSRSSIKLCLNYENYVSCLENMRDQLMEFGIDREASISNKEESPPRSDLDILKDVQAHLVECGDFSGEHKAQCEAIVAIAYNIEISNQHQEK